MLLLPLPQHCCPRHAQVPPTMRLQQLLLHNNQGRAHVLCLTPHAAASYWVEHAEGCTAAAELVPTVNFFINIIFHPPQPLHVWQACQLLQALLRERIAAQFQMRQLREATNLVQASQALCSVQLQAAIKQAQVLQLPQLSG